MAERGESQENADRSKRSSPAEKYFGWTPEKARKGKACQHRTLDGGWISRHLPSVVRTVLAEAGPSIVSGAIFGRDNEVRSRECPGCQREPRPAFETHSPDRAR